MIILEQLSLEGASLSYFTQIYPLPFSPFAHNLLCFKKEENDIKKYFF